MHKIHRKTELRCVGDDSWSLLLLDTTKEQERTECSHYAVDCAECPRNLNYRSNVYHAWCSLRIERPDSHGCTHYKRRKTYPETLCALPVKVYSDVVSQNKIAQITREVPQQMVLIPEALTPHFAYPAIEEWHTGRECKQTDEHQLLLCRSLTKPRRDDWNKEIQAKQWIYKPEVTRH